MKENIIQQPIYNYDRQTVVSRDENGKIKSIKPIYKIDEDDIIKFNNLTEDMKIISEKYPDVKFAAEIINIEDNDFSIIKDALGFKPNFTDHASKFFFNTNLNSVIIGYKKP